MRCARSFALANVLVVSAACTGDAPEAPTPSTDPVTAEVAAVTAGPAWCRGSSQAGSVFPPNPTEPGRLVVTDAGGKIIATSGGPTAIHCTQNGGSTTTTQTFMLDVPSADTYTFAFYRRGSAKLLARRVIDPQRLQDDGFQVELGYTFRSAY